MSFAVLALMLSLQTELTSEQSELVAALIEVESGGDDSAVGDGGKSIGCLQISEAYWKDSGVEGEWIDCYNREYAINVLVAYMKRYAQEKWRVLDAEHCSRLHNGGPKGPEKKATAPYWAKVKKILDRG